MMKADPYSTLAGTLRKAEISCPNDLYFLVVVVEQGARRADIGEIFSK